MNRRPQTQIYLRKQTGAIQVSIDRPEQHNALDGLTLNRLERMLLNNVEQNSILIPRGEQHSFSIGCDVRDLVRFDSMRASRYSQLAQRVCTLIEAWPTVTVAYIEGCALGLGLEIALACDVIVAHANAHFGLPGLPWSLLPCTAVIQRLSTRCDRQVLDSLLLRGNIFNAQEAREHHLADRVVTSAAELYPLTDELTEFSQPAVRAIREVRLRQQGHINHRQIRSTFAGPFADGSCPSALKNLLKNSDGET